MIIYGKQVSIYALKKHPEKILKIYLTKKEILPLELLRKFGDKIKLIENRWIQKLTNGRNHQGIALEIQELQMASLKDLKEENFLIILDGLTDVGNIGSIIRSAYALGADGIIASGVGQLNISGIVRSSSGALLDMPFLIKKNPLDLVNELKMANFKLYGASMEGEEIESKKFSKKRVLVLGSEGKGVSKRLKNKLDEVIAIKMKRDFDSLNVSAAAAIIIYRMSHGVE